MKFGLFILLLALVSCNQAEQLQIKVFDISSGEINLSRELNGEWERVCIITPYSSNETAKAILGFDFDVINKSHIYVQDGITLLITVKNNAVIEYFETPRNNVDFSSLKAGCYLREKSLFQVEKNENGWPYLKQLTQQGSNATLWLNALTRAAA